MPKYSNYKSPINKFKNKHWLTRNEIKIRVGEWKKLQYDNEWRQLIVGGKKLFCLIIIFFGGGWLAGCDFGSKKIMCA